MQVLKGIPAYFDVDETLMMFKAVEYDPTEFISSPNYHQIRKIKEHKFRGHLVVVWSAGGAEWAENAVRTLGLEGYVDLCIEKPRWFYDDKRAEEFMPETNRYYFKDEEE